MALRVSAITLASGSSEGKEALLVRDNNAAHDARTSYRSTSESVPPEAAASEQQLALRVLVTESDEDDSSDEELILLVLVQPWELQRCRCDITKMSLGAYRPKKLPRLRGEEHRRCYECLKPSSELPLVAGTFYLHSGNVL